MTEIMNEKQNEIISVLRALKKRFPNPGAMEVGGPFQALVGVMLSARTRDEQVIKLLPAFFKAFPDPKKLALASIRDIESRINTIGMYHQKAKNLKSMAQKLITDFNGTIPSTMDELTSLAGVGRKTASVILVYCFGRQAIAVDTHVHRVTNRLGWVKAKAPAQTEEKLLALIPPKWHQTVNRVFVKHVRYLCLPGNPRCWACPVAGHCAFPKKQMQRPKNAEAILQDIDRREQILLDLKSFVV